MYKLCATPCTLCLCGKKKIKAKSSPQRHRVHGVAQSLYLVAEHVNAK